MSICTLKSSCNLRIFEPPRPINILNFDELMYTIPKGDPES